MLRIEDDGTVRVVKAEEKGKILGQLQCIVGGMVNTAKIDYGERFALLVDDEGLLKVSRYNRKASRFCQMDLVGTAVICGIEPVRDEGYRFCELDESMQKEIENKLNML